jgi:uncharacterized protein
MGRFLVLVLLVVLAVWLVRRALRRSATRGDLRKSAQTAGELVRCVRCGVHLPRGEALQAAGSLYCSEEHARLGPGGR